MEIQIGDRFTDHDYTVGSSDPYEGGGGLENVTTMLLGPEQPSADQFAFPQPIAAGVEAVGPPGDVEFRDPLTLHPIAASAAGIAHAVPAEDSFGALARQGARVELLTNPVDQPVIPSAHSEHLDANTRKSSRTICAWIYAMPSASDLTLVAL
jgi:hypothetical protein